LTFILTLILTYAIFLTLFFAFTPPLQHKNTHTKKNNNKIKKQQQLHKNYYQKLTKKYS